MEQKQFIKTYRSIEADLIWNWLNDNHPFVLHDLMEQAWTKAKSNHGLEEEE